MTRLSRQVKNLHEKYGKGMSLRGFARAALSKETKLTVAGQQGDGSKASHHQQVPWSHRQE